MKPLNIKIINNETFYPLYEFEGKYFVNESGNKIYSLFYNRLLKVQEKEGYYYVNIILKGTLRKRFLHRLIADSLLLRTDDRNIVNHKNKDRKDNRIANLEWTYIHENYYHGIGVDNYKKDDNQARLFSEEEIKDIYTSSDTREELKKKYKKLTNMTYHDIKHNKTYKDITYNLKNGTSIFKDRMEYSKKISDGYVFTIWLNDYIIKNNSLKDLENEHGISISILKRRFKLMNLPLKGIGRYPKVKLVLTPFN